MAETDSETSTPSPEKPVHEIPPRHFGCLPAILVLLGIGGGIFAGAYWHDKVLPGTMTQAAPHDASHQAASAAKQLWTCSMHPQVIREEPGLCPICHMELTPLKSAGATATPAPDAAATEAAVPAERKIKYYWDPMMNPPYISQQPGKSPMGMELVPVYEDEVSAGPAVTIDPSVVQNIGVRTAEVTMEPLVRSVRAVGYLAEAEPNIYDFNVRIAGWVEKLHADVNGMHVKQGEPLFELYSPELQQALQELAITQTSPLPNRQELINAIRRRLSLWGLGDREIDRLAKMSPVPRTVTFSSPITGDVLEKNVVEGSAVAAGDRIFRLVDHTTLWLDAQVYEQDLPFIQLGQEVTATITSIPGEMFSGKVIFVHPHVDPGTRAATIRIEMPNLALRLRPGMYATVRVDSELTAQAVMVPREAIIDSGTRQVAFIMDASNRFEPRALEVGLTGNQGKVQVLEGIAPGERVVTSAQFLFDAESRLQEGIQKYLQDTLGNGAPEPPATPEALAPADTEQPVQILQDAALPEVDAFFTRYFTLTADLGKPQQQETPLPVADLVAAAQALQKRMDKGPLQDVVASVLKEAEQLEGKTLEAQREQHKKLSEAVLELAEAAPPSPSVADHLYVMYCSMAPGRWLQTTKEVANPYYATAMKQCGELVKTIRPVRGDAK